MMDVFITLIIMFSLVAITQIIASAILQDRREERERKGPRAY